MIAAGSDFAFEGVTGPQPRGHVVSSTGTSSASTRPRPPIAASAARSSTWRTCWRPRRRSSGRQSSRASGASAWHMRGPLAIESDRSITTRRDRMIEDALILSSPGKRTRAQHQLELLRCPVSARATTKGPTQLNLPEARIPPRGLRPERFVYFRTTHPRNEYCWDRRRDRRRPLRTSGRRIPGSRPVRDSLVSVSYQRGIHAEDCEVENTIVHRSSAPTYLPDCSRHRTRRPVTLRGLYRRQHPVGSGLGVRQRHTPGGSTGWFQGNEGGLVFPALDGTDGYIAANFNNAPFGGNISNWLMLPELTLNDGDSLSFLTRSNGEFPDRLNVRFSPNGASTSLGGFGSALFSVNAGLADGGYPSGWTLFTLTLGGLGGPTAGRLAFQDRCPGHERQRRLHRNRQRDGEPQPRPGAGIDDAPGYRARRAWPEAISRIASPRVELLGAERRKEPKERKHVRGFEHVCAQ